MRWNNKRIVSMIFARPRRNDGLLVLLATLTSILFAPLDHGVAQEPNAARESEQVKTSPASANGETSTDLTEDKLSDGDASDGDASDGGGEPQPTFRSEAVRGRVVWLATALKERFGISTVPEMAEQSLAIVTSDGQLLPLVENLRGRAFRKDERLRNTDMEIWVRRYDQQPLVQVLRVFELQEGQRYEVDYWCDVCAIPMYETGPCSCCQDHNRIRKRLVGDAEAQLDEAKVDEAKAGDL